VIEAGLKATTERSKIIANNIANIGTADYRRKEVQFEDLLDKALKSSNTGEDIDEIEPLVVEPHSTPVDANGNDVNLDMEVGEMVKNGSMHKTYLRLLNKMYRQMDYAIRGE
jgi:flagellar basal-body rod protein FlgB